MSTIYEIYNKAKTSDRDKIVLDRINYYISRNIQSISDGLLKSVPTISGETIDYMAQPYNLSTSDWNDVKKSKEWMKMKLLANPLKLGLLISYCDTQNVAYVNFLSILIYSSLMVKYFPKGFDKNIMKYTIDNADARTDFKKYEGSLMIVVNKKVETFLKLLGKNLKPGINDKNLRDALQSISTRLNEAVKSISTKYYKNFKDPDIKIMMEYSTTDDGKNILNSLGFMEAIRQSAVDNLASPSDKILTMIHLGSRDINNFKYRALFIREIPECFGLLSNCTSEMLDNWMRRHPNKVSVTLFRTDFIKTMSKARNVKEITSILEAVNDKMLLSVPDDKIKEYDRLSMRRFMYNYIMLNIYSSSSNVIK